VRYIDHHNKPEDWADDEGALAYLKSLKSYLKVGTVEQLASAIKEIDDTLTRFAGEYPGMFFEEAVVTVLKEIAFDDPSLKSAVDKVLVVLRELYGEEEDEY
jgi:hypothetical protein